MKSYPQRKSPRLHGYDYAQEGAYFVTVCTQHRAYLFGEVVEAEVELNTLGCIAQTCWEAIPAHFPHIELDAFVVMPNHMHGIVIIMGKSGGHVGDVSHMHQVKRFYGQIDMLPQVIAPSNRHGLRRIRLKP